MPALREDFASTVRPIGSLSLLSPPLTSSEAGHGPGPHSTHPGGSSVRNTDALPWVLPRTGPKYGLEPTWRVRSVRPVDESWTQPSSRGSIPSAIPALIDRSSRKAARMGSMALNELGKMLTAAEVAEMLHLHVNTVKRLGDRGELKYYRVCKRGDRRFLLEDVRRFLDNNR